MKLKNYLKKKVFAVRIWMTSLMIACMPVVTFGANKSTGGGFSGLCNGINNFCTSATPIIACVLVAELIIIGIKAQINKAEGKQAVKSDIIWVIAGTGIALCASALGEEISGWFIAG